MMEFFRSVLFLPPGASTVAEPVDALHISIITTTMVGATAVFLIAIAFTLKYRRRSSGEQTPQITAPVWYESLVIAGLLGLFILWWIIGLQQYVRMHETPEDAEEIYVTAKQWMWKFAHPNDRSAVGVMVVPRGHPVRLLVTSRDVVHSLFVPAFRIKQDAVPGRYTSIWFRADRAGTYPLLCAEYCGQAHSEMRARVVVLDPPPYRRWLEGGTPEPVARAEALPDVYIQDEAQARLPARGKKLAARYGCLNCHTVDGQDHLGPTWLGLFGSTEVLRSGARIRVDEDYLTESMMEPQARRAAGYETIMPTYKGVLSHIEVAAIVEYIKSLEDAEQPPAVDLPPMEPAGNEAREETPPPDAGTPTSPGESGAPSKHRGNR